MQCTHCKSAVDPAARACPCCGAALPGMPDASVVEPVMNPVVNPVANSVVNPAVNPVVNPVMQPQVPLQAQPMAQPQPAQPMQPQPPLQPQPMVQPQPAVHRRSFLNHCKTLKPWQKFLCVLVPCVFVLAVGIGGYVVAAHVFDDNITPDTIKAVYMENADFVANGLMKSKFVKQSDYKITDLTIVSEEKVPQHDIEESIGRPEESGVYAMRICTVHATIQNDNFKTTFTDRVRLDKNKNGEWHSNELAPAAYSDVTTVPIKGVTLDKDEKDGYAFEQTDEAPVEQKDGKYVCAVPCRYTESNWYGKRVVNYLYSFAYFEKSGWEVINNKHNDAKETTSVEWDVAGKTFTNSDTMHRDSTETMTITINNVNDKTADVSYTYECKPLDATAQFKPLVINGRLAATVAITSSDVVLKVHDTSNNVTLLIRGVDGQRKRHAADRGYMVVNIKNDAFPNAGKGNVTFNRTLTLDKQKQ